MNIGAGVLLTFGDSLSLTANDHCCQVGCGDRKILVQASANITSLRSAGTIVLTGDLEIATTANVSVSADGVINVIERCYEGYSIAIGLASLSEYGLSLSSLELATMQASTIAVYSDMGSITSFGFEVDVSSCTDLIIVANGSFKSITFKGKSTAPTLSISSHDVLINESIWTTKGDVNFDFGIGNLQMMTNSIINSAGSVTFARATGKVLSSSMSSIVAADTVNIPIPIELTRTEISSTFIVYSKKAIKCYSKIYLAGPDTVAQLHEIRLSSEKIFANGCNITGMLPTDSVHITKSSNSQLYQNNSIIRLGSWRWNAYENDLVIPNSLLGSISVPYGILYIGDHPVENQRNVNAIFVRNVSIASVVAGSLHMEVLKPNGTLIFVDTPTTIWPALHLVAQADILVQAELTIRSATKLEVNFNCLYHNTTGKFSVYNGTMFNSTGDIELVGGELELREESSLITGGVLTITEKCSTGDSIVLGNYQTS